MKLDEIKLYPLYDGKETKEEYRLTFFFDNRWRTKARRFMGIFKTTTPANIVKELRRLAEEIEKMYKPEIKP